MPQVSASVGLAASRVRFEEKAIMAALERRRVPFQQLDTRTLWFDLDERLRLPHALVLNREIAQTRSAYLARLVESFGVPAINPARVVELCSDKLLTSIRLRQAGLPTPRTAVALTTAAAAGAMERLGFPVVVKPLVGSWGRLLALVRDHDAATALLEHREALPAPQARIVYLQELIDKPGRDIRVIVVGEEPLGATYRIADQWRTNAARGAVSVRCPLADDLSKLAVAAAQAVGGEVVGVDLLEGPGGELYVLEVNHNVEFRGFQAAHGERVDVADAIVGYALRRVAA
jgi:[lysine-biosynthesis-protein LysW]--L-2-aminoadipate ligase